MATNGLPQGLDRPEKIEEPVLRQDSFSAERYISREYAREEWQKVFSKTWNIAGVSYQLEEPGDFINCELAHESIICVRAEDGSVNAFYNSCPHRGTRIVSGEGGYVEKFTCPYHGWQFDKAGETIYVPDEEDFALSPCGNARLKSVKCTERFGFVWINMDPDCESLEDSLGEQIVKELDSYNLEKTIRVLNITADAPCNWKIITDNFNEAYHVKVLHPGLIPYIEADYKACQFDLFKNGHNRGWFPSHNPSILHKGDEVADHLAAIMQMWDLDPSQYIGRENHLKIRKHLQQAKRKLGVERGYKHYENYTDYQFTDYVIYNLFPNSVITVGPDGVQLLRPRPHPSGDPARCLFDHWWMVHPVQGMEMTPSPAGGEDLPVKDAEYEYIVYGEKTLGTTADEDLSIAKTQQEGLASNGFQPFFMPNQERRVQRFHENLNDLMAK